MKSFCFFLTLLLTQISFAQQNSATLSRSATAQAISNAPIETEIEELIELPSGLEVVDDYDESQSDLEAELKIETDGESSGSTQREVPVSPIPESVPTPKAPVKSTMTVDEEEALQKKILEKKIRGETVATEVTEMDRFPKIKPLFKKPSGPSKGGKVKVNHPRAKQGLVSISSEGIYQYKTKTKERTQSGVFKIGMMTPPTIDSGNSQITFESMYSNNNIPSFRFEYEMQPFKASKNIGLRFGGGLATVSGQGFFRNTNSTRTDTRSQEKYNLYIIPASLMASYRFEYSRRQWIVPYIVAGGEGYGLAEIRSDNTRNNFAWSASAGGGGGILLPISRLDAYQAFTLSEEYGISDMWLSIEGLYMQGINAEVDFTHQQVSLGIQVDF